MASSWDPSPTSTQLWAFVAWTCLLMAPSARADGVSTSAQTQLPDWASTNSLWMTLSTQGGSKPLSQQLTVFSVTDDPGLNTTDRIGDTVNINGNLVVMNASNYNTLNTTEDVAYLSCDKSSHGGFLDPSSGLNILMQKGPKAIILYSTVGNWCSLSNQDSSLDYTNILSMTDAGDSQSALSYLNGTSTGTVVDVAISGNSSYDGESQQTGGGKSGVAMSILYTITGLITLLFLGIIGTGAVRAHRHPERYGPRGALAGRPRQSRAKGLARAMLETLPIVKFGDKAPEKPDPELELDNASKDPERATQRTASMLSDDRHSAVAVAGTQDVAESTTEGTAAKEASSSNDPVHPADAHLGCSICTEDFTVGEDVRLLPCNHQFHPTCIDPWLINVSGTCPLCRLDLRVGNEHLSTNEDLPPPLALEGEEASNHGRNRISRFFDINRLRQASPEEQMAALRRIREEDEQGEQPSHSGSTEGSNGEHHRHGATFTAKLKEKFRIKTRAQAPDS